VSVLNPTSATFETVKPLLGEAYSMVVKRLSNRPLHYYAVRVERGGPWDWSRGLREQAGWDEHARFMDGLVDEGFILLGGPLQGDRDVLHIVTAPSEQAIRDRLADDPWSKNGMLTIRSIERWTILLDGRR
jgi:hypothetical protein